MGGRIDGRGGSAEVDRGRSQLARDRRRGPPEDEGVFIAPKGGHGADHGGEEATAPHGSERAEYHATTHSICHI